MLANTSHVDVEPHSDLPAVQGLKCHTDGYFSQAAFQLETALALAQGMRDERALAMVLSLLPALYLDMRRLGDGRRTAKAALALPSNASPQLQRLLNATLLSIEAQQLLQDFEAACRGMTKEQALQNPAVLRQLPRVQEVNSHIASMQQAAGEARAAGDTLSLSTILVSLGTLLNKINGEGPRAAACLTEALDLQHARAQPQHEQSEAFLLTQLGVAHKACGKLPAAAATLQQAEQLQITLQRMRQGEAAITIAELQQETYLQLQDTLMQQGRFEEGLLAAERSRVLALQQILNQAGRRADDSAADVSSATIREAAASSGKC